MPQDAPAASLAAEAPSGWHSIRPWSAQLSLYVREITSVSATFILATDLTGEIELDTSLATLGFNAAADSLSDEDQQRPSGSHGADEATPPSQKTQSLISETLSKGLRVSVNNVNWQRVLIRVDEKTDEAIIIIYGLMPGRQYDIDLALVQAGQAHQQIRRQVSTFEHHSDPDSVSEMSTDPESPSYDHSVSSSSDAHHTISTPSTSPSRTIPNTPPPPPSNTTLSSSVSSGSSSTSTDSSSPPQVSLEERLNQLRHNLSAIDAERDNLLASLKSARKESQKAEAVLRSEMEALKRASEKHSAGEARSKQKILALQEAVKRAQGSTKDTETQAASMGSGMPELLRRRDAKEHEYKKVKEEADDARSARDIEVGKDKKRQESMRTELQSLTNKLERLTMKKEKQENTTIPDLESQLSAVEMEIAGQQRLLLQLEEYEDVNRGVLNSMGPHPQQSSGNVSNPYNPSPPYFSKFGDHQVYMPVQRTRHQSLGATQSGSSNAVGPGPIGRPTRVAPIQRPNFSSSTSTSSPSLSLDLSSSAAGSPSPASIHAQFQQLMSSPGSSIWTPPARQPSGSGHSGRSSSLHYQPQSSMSVYRDTYFQDQQQHIPPSQAQQLPLTSLSSHPQHSAYHQQLFPPLTATNTTRAGSSKSKTVPSLSSSTGSSAIHPSTSATSLGQASSSSTTSSSGSSARTSPPGASTLSVRAPAFEPGKGRSFGLRISTAQAKGASHDGTRGSGSGGAWGTLNSVGTNRW